MNKEEREVFNCILGSYITLLVRNSCGTQTKFASKTGIPPNTVSRLCAGKVCISIINAFLIERALHMKSGSLSSEVSDIFVYFQTVKKSPEIVKDINNYGMAVVIDKIIFDYNFNSG